MVTLQYNLRVKKGDKARQVALVAARELMKSVKGLITLHEQHKEVERVKTQENVKGEPLKKGEEESMQIWVSAQLNVTSYDIAGRVNKLLRQLLEVLKVPLTSRQRLNIVQEVGSIMLEIQEYALFASGDNKGPIHEEN